MNINTEVTTLDNLVEDFVDDLFCMICEAVMFTQGQRTHKEAPILIEEKKHRVKESLQDIICLLIPENRLEPTEEGTSEWEVEYKAEVMDEVHGEIRTSEPAIWRIEAESEEQVREAFDAAFRGTLSVRYYITDIQPVIKGEQLQ